MSYVNFRFMTFHDISHLYNLYQLFCLGHDHWFLSTFLLFSLCPTMRSMVNITRPPPHDLHLHLRLFHSGSDPALAHHGNPHGAGLFGSRHLVYGHATGSDLLEVPTMYKVFLLGLWFRGCTPKIWPNIWYSTSILGSWNSHWLGYINHGILTLGTNCI